MLQGTSGTVDVERAVGPARQKGLSGEGVLSEDDVSAGREPLDGSEHVLC